jgi:DNA-binding transcriptional ArsR family regulator
MEKPTPRESKKRACTQHAPARTTPDAYKGGFVNQVYANAVQDAAADYRRRGWSIIRLKGKVAAEPWAQYQERRMTVEEIEEKPWPGVGIVTGAISGGVVLDADSPEAVEVLKRRGHPVTPMAKTARGMHLYFQHPGEELPTAIGLGDGLDLKGDGGYVVAPPSRHPSGVVYEWIISPDDGELAPLPAWVMEQVQVRSRRAAREDLGDEIPNGSRNETLASAGGALRRLGYGEAGIRAALLAINSEMCNPPLDEREVQKIARSMAGYPTADDRAKLLVPSSSPSPNGNDGDATPVTTVQLSQVTPPRGPRPYLIEGVLPERFPTAIYGDGGTAKTTTALHLLQSVVRGEKEWLGHKITRSTGALFIDFELDLEEQARRAYEVAHGLGYTAPPDGLHYLSAVGHKARKVLSHALGFCKKHEVGLVVVDSLGVAMEGDAELARDVLRFVREMLDPFRAAGITPLIVDHQAKLQAGERYQGKTMFGSVYKSNAVRSVFQLEVRERQENAIRVTLRHKKSNFGSLLNPFGARIEWAYDKTTIAPDELTAGELAEESTMNVADRLLLALEGGPAYPEDLAEAIGAEYRTVKNKLTDLRKAGKVEDTGEVRNRSHEVRLAQASSSFLLSDGDGDASKHRTGNELWKDRAAELGRKL